MPILAIDQGTTSTRAILFNRKGEILASNQRFFKQYFPSGGWVEHDPEEIWQSTLAVCRSIFDQNRISPTQIDALGITNQRETTVVWDKKTGKPVYNAIVWQDRRTAKYCAVLKAKELLPLFQRKTGLLPDPYFSATKIAWILDNVPNARLKAKKGELAFGTINTFLLWRLTNGAVHATDPTNASRTLLYDIHTQKWDEELLDLFKIPGCLLPEVRDCNAQFGATLPSLFSASIPITGLIGDQQAASVGQACFESGMVKSTYGTGCFMLFNTGEKTITSQNQLLTTIAYRLSGKTTYALEGSVFIAGAVVQWLRDQMQLIQTADETAALAACVPNNGGIYFVPAFTGLGAPHWDPYARGAIFGLTRNTQKAHVVRAALEAVCFQTKDLLLAMEQDSAGNKEKIIRVDGGMAKNDWLMQTLSDVLQVPVERPCVIETTALGAAFVAGLGAGIYQSLSEITQLWKSDKIFEPKLEKEKAHKLYQGWQKAVANCIR